ncbi:MAG: cysteine desulfurase family protein [Microbacteriaceae bacterium]
MIYLDHAATSPVRREVLEAMWPWLTAGFGNPSSHHEPGRRAADALAEARARIARALGARASDVVLTSGGTEGDNLAIKGIALAAPRGRHLVTAATEHEAVLASCRYLERLHGFTVSLAPVDGEGVVTPEALASVLRPDTTLVSIAHGNNEIGVAQDLPALAGLAREAGARFHADAVQSAAWADVGPAALGADAVTIAGHKLGAPAGIGALVLRRAVPLEPLVHGGGQERGRRSGTENVAGAVGLATALELAAESRAAADRVAGLRDALIDGVLAAVPGARLTGPRRARLPNHASFCFPGSGGALPGDALSGHALSGHALPSHALPGTSGEAVLLELERRGVVASSGSACAAGSDEPSHVLTAIGVEPAVAQTAVRFTLDAATSAEDVRIAVGATAEAVARLAALTSR